MKPRIDPAALLANASWVERLARSLIKDEALAYEGHVPHRTHTQLYFAPPSLA